ncbi:MAG: thioredoxin family protein [Deltaproteobacteria bacterium]|nr:thioredoxin family protein [Deltaproteobacteria bacterium]
MAVLKDVEKEKLRQLFQGLMEPVTLLLFTQETECQFCETTRTMLEEVTALSDKLSLTIRDFVADTNEAERYGVDKIPATVILGAKDYGIRFFGIPSGYEFTVLIQDILGISKGVPGLSEETLTMISAIGTPAHLQVFISPACPYCPSAARMVHQFAMASDHVRGDVVESSEYPHLTVKYNVSGVPHTVINEDHSIVGVLPEKDFAREILKVLGVKWEGADVSVK